MILITLDNIIYATYNDVAYITADMFPGCTFKYINDANLSNLTPIVEGEITTYLGVDITGNAYVTDTPNMGTAYNKNFGTGTTNIIEIGSTILGDKTLETDTNGKVVSITKKTGYNLDTGTIAGTLATGNHTHTDYHLPSYSIVSSDQATTEQSLVDITGMSLSLEANSTYELEAILIELESADANGAMFGVNLSSTTGASMAVTMLMNAVASTSVQTAFNTAIGSVVQCKTNGGTHLVIIKGVIITGGSAPTLTIQHRKETSGKTTTKIGSYVKAIKLA
jgi:hypothetical protein